MSEPSRQILWNIPLGELIYIIAVIVVGIMVYAVVRRYRMWHLGKEDARLTGGLSLRWKEFIRTAVVDGLIHRKFFGVADNLGHRSFRFKDFLPKELYPGLAHFLIMVGCCLLLLGTALDVISHYVVEFIEGNFYFIHSMFVDIGGIMALIGVIMVYIRRYGQKPKRLDNQTGDFIALLAIVLIVITGFVVEGLRVAANEIVDHPAWSVFSPGGYILARAFGNFSHSSLLIAHRTMWWIHSIITFGFLVYIALYFNRLWHIIVSPLNVFWRNLGARGAMLPIDLEKAQSYGVSRVEDYSWKNLLDLDACTRCGRCADICPANLSGKPLSPKKVLQDLKANWLEKAPSLMAARAKAKKAATAGKPDAAGENQPADAAATAAAETAPEGSDAQAGAESKPMIGGVIETEAIWNCTTCFACQEVCPVWAEPMLKISEMRRNLVLEQASIPESAEGALRSIEDRGHPWRGTLLTRTSWFEDLDIKALADDSNVDVLYWVGCTEALEDRSLKVARATGQLLKIAGVKFGVLGTEESCCGDPARRLGNEYLYQMQAQKNIEVLKNYNVKKIVTGCPHCYNTLRHEYPQFGGNFEVVHHSQFLLQLLQEGKLKVSKGPMARATFHDPCYLGRYNNIYEAPRQILSYVPDITLVEMERNRERNFCCGAGGGHLWLEEQKAGERINVMRTDQAMATGASLVATACPYCLQMFQDGTKTRAVDETLKILDIAEILAQSAVYNPCAPRKEG
jgi:Fe-S oxidoreductase/nitrate reductase gamma subunit